MTGPVLESGVLEIGLIYPTVLGTYGDSGNALVLAERARRRGFGARVVPVEIGEPVPASLDIYTLGGGEDTAQALAAEHLRAGAGGMVAAQGAGAPVLAICASMQILGTEYTDAAGRRVGGLGLLDIVTTPRGSRAIGELIEAPLLEGLTGLLTGFENHGGGTCLGPDAEPFGRVLAGVGNACATDGEGPWYEGAVQGSVIGTYMHGPVLARNPQLADLILSRVLGPLEPLEVPWVEALRGERLAEVPG